MLKHRVKNQQGVVLITGLIFLLVLTLIGITSMSSTALTEKMTQNFRDYSTAFEAAESALGDGESWVQNQGTTPVPVSTCSSSPCKVWTYNTFSNFWTQSTSWWQTNAIPYSSTIGGVATQPYYIIEQYAFVPYQLSPDALSKGQGYYYYRITALGTGATTTSRAVVQSMFATQFN
ncbi:MAG: pilus assembly protein PilZ [Proteobacteria bacterium]|nr:pilus assembly protein PilZ [Pseudomonadota bacterium]